MGLGSFIKKMHDPFGHGEKIKKKVGLDKLNKFEDKIFTGIDDMQDFERNNFKYMLRGLKENPERAFLGAIDPFSSKMWGSVTGKDYDPLLNQMGGPSAGSYADAIEKGINVNPSMTSHQIASAIASWYAGGALSAAAPASVPISQSAGAGAVGAGAAVSDAELDPIALETQYSVPGSLRVGTSPDIRQVAMQEVVITKRVAQWKV